MYILTEATRIRDYMKQDMPNHKVTFNLLLGRVQYVLLKNYIDTEGIVKCDMDATNNITVLDFKIVAVNKENFLGVEVEQNQT